jgi:hypothetical protein
MHPRIIGVYYSTARLLFQSFFCKNICFFAQKRAKKERPTGVLKIP